MKDVFEKSSKEWGLGVSVKQIPGRGLTGRFILPPFSILHAGSGTWRQRKQRWLDLGIKSEVGRGGETMRGAFQNYESMVRSKLRDNRFYSPTRGYVYGKDVSKGNNESAWQNTSASVFDPVLCEIMYSWFCPTAGQIIDPFAGGSVRGVVAVYMGYSYWGCELRKEQVDANYIQAKSIIPKQTKTTLHWVCGDSKCKLKDAPQADFIFSCPPYGNLEKYSDLEGDISNMSYADFLTVYKRIIKLCCLKLKQDRFACFVVSNYRDKKSGFYYNLVGDTVQAFEEAGVRYYNDIVLETAHTSLPVRAGGMFTSSRKVGRTHQNVLVFYKGNTKKIKEVMDESIENGVSKCP